MSILISFFDAIKNYCYYISFSSQQGKHENFAYHGNSSREIYVKVKQYKFSLNGDEDGIGFYLL